MKAQVESSTRRGALLILQCMYILLWFGCAPSDVVPDSRTLKSTRVSRSTRSSRARIPIAGARSWWAVKC